MSLVRRSTGLLTLVLAVVASQAQADCGCSSAAPCAQHSVSSCGGCGDTGCRKAGCRKAGCRKAGCRKAGCGSAGCGDAGCGVQLVERTVMRPQYTTETRTVTATEYKQEARTRTYTVIR